MSDNNMETCVTMSDAHKSAAPHHHRRRSTTALCHVCGKMMKYATSLRTHCAHLHAVDKRTRRQSTGEVALCQYCGKAFNHTGDLKKHENTHTDQRPYVCNVESCRMGFTTSSNLARHKRTHSDVTVFFQCIYCGSKYTRKWAFNDHLRKKHFTINQ